MSDRRDEAADESVSQAQTVLRRDDSTLPGNTIVRGRQGDYTTLLEIDPAHYIRERELARGGMGRIIVARDRRIGREIAIKEMRGHDETMRMRFEREARITARLQHPSTIALHEAGVWPTGEPFFTMPLVAGRPLDKVIADARTVEARFGLIANVLAIADTLAYAHDRRIVHRDLKPQNVLIGEFGETVVIDWGLAKDLDAAATDAETLRPSQREVSGGGSGSNAATEHGSVIGTPAYMPLEQAEGLPVDERADVYALGAILYQVLAGVPPYSGRTSTAVLAEVLDGPPRPLAALVPEAPPDLVTIVEKAMARDREGRYRTAKELAAELRKFQTGQLVGSHRYTLGELVKRWAHKHRSTLAVAGAAVVALAVIGAIAIKNVVESREVAEHERTLATHQRALAEQRDAESQELVSFMLINLHDKLIGVGKLELLETVAAKVIDFYDRRGADKSTHDRIQRARALSHIGDVLVSRGQVTEARAQYDKARAIQEAVLASDPNSLEAAFGLANTHDRIASAALGVADTVGAETNEREAIRRLEWVLARAPEHTDAARMMLQVQRTLGDTLLDLGNGAGAMAAYRAAIDLAKTHLARTPDDLRWKRGLAIVSSQLAQLLLVQGDADGALREQRLDMTLSGELARATPTDTRAQNDYAGARLRLGDMLLATGDAAAALTEFRASLATMKHLTTLDPMNADWAHDLCACHDRIGNLLLAQKNTAGARAEYEACFKLRAQLVERDPKSWQKRNLGVSHNKLGNVLEKEGKPAEALAMYERGRPLFESVVASDPGNAALQRDLSVNLYLAADMLLATGRRTAALERHKQARDIVVQLAAKDPSNAVWRSDVIESHVAIGKVLVALGERREALAEYRAGLALAKAAATSEPDNPAWASYAQQIEDAIDTCCATWK